MVSLLHFSNHSWMFAKSWASGGGQDLHYVRFWRTLCIGRFQSACTRCEIRLCRPTLGLGPSIMGEAGVRHVMRSLLADFNILMNVNGFQNIQQITRDALEKDPKDYEVPHIVSKL